MARIYDNIDISFKDALQLILKTGGIERADFCVGYFNMRGWDMVDEYVENIKGGYVEEGEDGEESKFRVCRILVGMFRPPKDIVRDMYNNIENRLDNEKAQICKRQIVTDFRKQLLLGLPTSHDESTLRNLSRQMKDGKVCIKLYLQEPLHAKLYLAYRPQDPVNKIIGIMGSSNLTYGGFTGQGELNAEFLDSDHVDKLARWFDDRWNNKFSLDITNELIQAIDDSWASETVVPPYYIYLKTAYHLSEEARSGIMAFTLNKQFRHDLLDFQQIAVKMAARHLQDEKRRGAMIGDVVGLGKTIMACAIAKIYETTYGSGTLIICPANLTSMWEEKYVKKYDLKADVLSMSKTINKEEMRYYKLIIIDESHNLRAGTRSKRYNNIKELIKYQNSNVLLLTATPYNKDFTDLANQLELFIDKNQDIGIRPEKYIEYLGGERKFMEKHSEIFIRSIEAFEQSCFEEDWNDLMRLFLIRRTRTFIKDNYAKTDPESGRKYIKLPDGTRNFFPDRIPHAVKYVSKKGDQMSLLYSEQMMELMEKLWLPRYGLSNYIEDKKTAIANKEEKVMINDLSRAGARMMGFCRSTFFKRMDSSGFAFLVSLYRHLMRNIVFIYAIDNELPLPIGDEYVMPDYFADDEDDSAASIFDNTDNKSDNVLTIPTDIDFFKKKAGKVYNLIRQNGRVRWLSSEYFKQTLKKRLKSDCDNIIDMLRLCGTWNPKEDKKLDALERLLNDEHKNDKVIVFTQYSDTAEYIYKQLRLRGISHIGCATGSCADPTSIAERFSPVSNDVRNRIMPDAELRVLIATDVLSEGQNLQDAHVVVNYDLPWAIIRLIQRAGRVDRIGQTSTTIDCYSFFPQEGIENIIRLRARLNARINQNAQVIGSDEVFFEGNEKNLTNIFNEKSGVLDDTNDIDVDLPSQAYQIWKAATDADPKLKEIIPNLSNMIYSAKHADTDTPEGVITYIRTGNGFDVLSWLDSQGNIVSQSPKRILNALECSADTEAVDCDKEHLALVGKTVDIIKQQGQSGHTEGILGNRFSTRYRIIKMLENHSKRPVDMFFTQEKKDEMKLATDELYKHQLIDTTKTILGQMLRRNNNENEVVEEVMELYRSNNLCNKPEDGETDMAPQIVCSMGLRHIDE